MSEKQVVKGDEARPPEPPKPPQIARHVRLTSLQKIGIPLLALLPLLSLIGLFYSEGFVEAQGSPLSLRVEYPDRIRYGMFGRMTIEVINNGDEAAGPVTVQVDGAYLTKFEQLAAAPASESVTPAVFEFEIAEIPAGEGRKVVIEKKAEVPGRHRGRIAARGPSGEPVQTEVVTVIFP